MNRRHFIKLSGTTGAALLLGNLSFAQGNNSILQLPHEVWAQTDEGWFKLPPGTAATYAAKGVAVAINQQGNGLQVYVQSWKRPLKNIRLQWQYNTTTQLCLVDHW